MENLSKLFQKQKRKKKHTKKLSFITQCKIRFLLQFTGCRKLFGKMPVDKADPLDPARMEFFWMRVLRTITPLVLNIDEGYRH